MDVLSSRTCPRMDEADHVWSIVSRQWQGLFHTIFRIPYIPVGQGREQFSQYVNEHFGLPLLGMSSFFNSAPL